MPPAAATGARSATLRDMDAKDWILPLLLIGFALELTGVVLTVIEIQRRLTAVRDLQILRVTKQVSAMAYLNGKGTLTVGGPPQDVEGRLAAAERRLAGLDDELEALRTRAVAEAVQAASNEVRDLENVTMQHITGLRDAVAKTSGGGARAFLGVGLILFGFVLQTISSIISALQPIC